MNLETIQKIHEVKALMDENPDLILAGEFPEGAPVAQTNAVVPDDKGLQDYRSFLSLTDGPAMGMMLFLKTADLQRAQDLIGEQAVSLFVIGFLSDRPLVVVKDTGEVLLLASRNRNFGSFQEFLSKWLLSPAYEGLLGERRSDEWSELIRIIADEG